MSRPLKGTPAQGLWGATLGFSIGFAAVALFGPTAARFQEVMGLSPMAVGFLVAMPSLSGSLLRIPFAAWVETTGGRKPFLVLLALSILGMAGLTAVSLFIYPERLTAAWYPALLLLGLFCGCGIATFSVGIGQVSYWHRQRQQGRALAIYAGFGNVAPGIFTFILPFALAQWGLATSYVAWFIMLLAGTVLYAMVGRNSWYFQLRQQGISDEQARRDASTLGQELFPARNLIESLRESARCPKTWALVCIYFTTFGGFIALTAWLPTYYTQFYGLSPQLAGGLAGLFSLLCSLIRVGGGVLADRLREGGENTATLALLILLSGTLVMISANRYELALPGEVLMAFGMGVANAAVFKMVPQAVPHAVGGASGWVGGLGAFGGFVIPPVLAFAVRDLGQAGYAIGFIVFVFLTLLSLTMTWILKYPGEPEPAPPSRSNQIAEPLASQS
ncbi:MAG: MFS transporter [Bryobacterales bacterium]|nr:MFS transporter [Bryobacterales bacterium]